MALRGGVAGTGCTMSLFITDLAFPEGSLVEETSTSIHAGSSPDRGAHRRGR